MQAKNAWWTAVVGGIMGTMLWAGPVGAQPFPGGLPACQGSLNTCTTSLTQTQEQLSTCTSNLTQAEGGIEYLHRQPQYLQYQPLSRADAAQCLHDQPQ
jgi:hypothetical protein